MADSTITDLPSATSIAGTEVLPVDQSGSTKKVAIADLTPGLDPFVGDGGSPAATKGLVPAPASGDAAAGKFLKADATWDVPPGTGGGGGTTVAATCGGRLTLTTGVPVTTTDVTGATTIYFTPYKGAQIGLYNGSSWDVISFTETSIALGTLTSGKNYDVFAYNNSGTLALEFSSAWTSDTARADALALQDGIYCKSGTLTRRYLGTFRTTSTTTTEDSGGGSTTQVGGKRFLWNYCNRIPRFIAVIDKTDSWSYSTASWRQADNASGNQVEYVCGWNEEIVNASLMVINTATSGNSRSSIGIDSTSTPSRFVANGVSSSSITETICCQYSDMAGLGYHKLVWLEYGTTGATWFGDNGGTLQNGLTAWIRG